MSLSFIQSVVLTQYTDSNNMFDVYESRFLIDSLDNGWNKLLNTNEQEYHWVVALVLYSEMSLSFILSIDSSSSVVCQIRFFTVKFWLIVQIIIEQQWTWNSTGCWHLFCLGKWVWKFWVVCRYSETCLRTQASLKYTYNF